MRFHTQSHTLVVCSIAALETEILINYFSCIHTKKTRKNGTFVIVYAALLNNFHFDWALMRTKQSTFHLPFILLMIGRIFHWLASSSIHFKSYYWCPIHILTVLGTIGPHSYYDMTSGSPTPTPNNQHGDFFSEQWKAKHKFKVSSIHSATFILTILDHCVTF